MALILGTGFLLIIALYVYFIWHNEVRREEALAKKLEEDRKKLTTREVSKLKNLDTNNSANTELETPTIGGGAITATTAAIVANELLDDSVGCSSIEPATHHNSHSHHSDSYCESDSYSSGDY